MNLDGNKASINEAIDAGLLSGAVTVAWQAGEVLQVNELGYRDVEAGLPMQRDTMFRIASMTKPITVAAAMTLVDEGRLALTDPVTKWLPELGYRDVEARLPMQRDTMFRIASMSKPVTVAAAMTLLDEGRFALTDPVAKWLPELSDLRVMADVHGSLDDTVPAERPITFDDLMTHRSGLAYAFSVPGPLARAYGKLSHRQDQDSWLADLAKLPLAHQPGERLTYSVSTDVLGIALSRIEDKPLADVLSERIFEPLGMPDTGFSVGPNGRGARGDDVPTRRDDTSAPRLDGPGADHGSAALQWRGGPVVDGRRLSAVRADAARRAEPSTGCGCCPRSRPG